MRFEVSRLVRRGLVVLSLAAPAVATPALATDLNWPQFRGPEGQGVTHETGIALEGSDTKNVLWKPELPGRGHCSPIVWGDRIFLTTAIEGEVGLGAKAVKHMVDGEEFVHPDGMGADRRHTFQVLALEAKNGRILWERTAWEGTPVDSRHRRGSFAPPPPATDRKRAYAHFGSGGPSAQYFD